ncbi:hypothetical protein CH63R_09619 [Colletotrichum higginsianum IMI 349063]|uniref:Uncharacterized protein n=1 Tax=Colletotrichum higginsianum (strain IMI 349063) TaxID=759273 RepID=A0A1B7Y839_COLHI|nr:hypothetical protein CH63R_09619 [Colletotrichum higginsianum IMI 349063]OBR08098.1 hypothetical protein CH63R_09619 [Colletotrichum higginsianum IMI 349063]
MACEANKLSKPAHDAHDFTNRIPSFRYGLLRRLYRGPGRVDRPARMPGRYAGPAASRQFLAHHAIYVLERPLCFLDVVVAQALVRDLLEVIKVPGEILMFLGLDQRRPRSLQLGLGRLLGTIQLLQLLPIQGQLLGDDHQLLLGVLV